MMIELNQEEVELLKVLLLAELEEKRVEIHHARNAEFKVELQKQEEITIRQTCPKRHFVKCIFLLLRLRSKLELFR